MKWEPLGAPRGWACPCSVEGGPLIRLEFIHPDPADARLYRNRERSIENYHCWAGHRWQLIVRREEPKTPQWHYVGQQSFASYLEEA